MCCISDGDEFSKQATIILQYLGEEDKITKNASKMWANRNNIPTLFKSPREHVEIDIFSKEIQTLRNTFDEQTICQDSWYSYSQYGEDSSEDEIKFEGYWWGKKHLV